MISTLTKNKRGFSITEVLLSGALFVMFVTAFVGAIHFSQESASVAGLRARAVEIAEEGLEAVRNIRDEQFSSLTNGSFGLTTVGNIWSLMSGNDLIDIFTRQITISSVDAKTKQILVSVTWPQTLQRTGSIQLITYLTNWAASGIGSWATPSQQAALDMSGGQDGLKIKTNGNYAYLIRDGGTPNFAIIDISNPATPVEIGNLSLNGNPTDLAIEGNYAYIASDDNSSELQIISIANPTAPTLSGTYNASGNTNATSIFVVSSTVYLGRNESSQDEFSLITATNPASPTLAGSLSLSDRVNAIAVNGNYAYLATDINSGELQIISLLIPSLPTVLGIHNVSGNTDALSVVIKDTSTIVLGCADDSLSLVNVSLPTTPTLLSVLDTGGNVNDIALGNGNTYAFLATGANSTEFQVINLTTTTNPSVLGTFNLSADAKGIAYHTTLDRALAATVNNNEEMVIVQPQ